MNSFPTDRTLEEIYRQDYPNLISCFQRNTGIQPIQRQDLKDRIEEQVQEMDIESDFSISTNLRIEEAEMFKIFIPEALNDTLFNNPNILRKFGRIRCLSSKGDYLAVGSNLGAVLNIHIGQEVPKSFTEIRREVGNQVFTVHATEICQCEHGSVNNLCFNKTSTQLAVGFDLGIIGIFDVVKLKNIKWLKTHTSRIISLVYINETMLISSDEQGNTFITRICKGTLFYDVDSQMIMKQQAISFIRPLPEKFKQFINIPDNTIFAMGNGSKCWVLKVNENQVGSISILWDIQNENTNNNQCWIEWSMEKVEGKERLLLGIVWSKCVRPYFFVQLEKQENKIIAIFKVLREFQLDASLVYLNSVYKNLFLILTERGNAFTSNLQISQIQKVLQMPKFDILPLMYWKDNKYESQFSCCISNNEIFQEIYILTESQIMVLKYYNFEDKFRHFLEQNSYQLCFQLLLCAHRKIFMEIDRNLLLQLASQMSTLYLQKVIKNYTQNQKDQATKEMISLVEFLLAIDADNIFTILNTILEKMIDDKGAFLSKIIEPFIIKKMIKYLPDEVLTKVLTILKQEKKLAVINLLLQNLEIKRVNLAIFQQACLENQLFQPMILLCTSPEKNEFLTPLVQIWNYSLKQMQLEKFELEIIYLQKSISYLTFLLKGKLLTGESLPQSQHFSLIEQEMSPWLFETTHLKRLIQIDPLSSFELLFNIFLLTTRELIEFDHRKNMKKIDEAMSEFYNPAYKHNLKQSKLIKNDFIFTVSGRENNKAEAAYCYFIIRLILILKLKPEFEETLQVLLFYAFNKSYLFFIDYKSYAEVIDKAELSILEQHQSHSNIIEYCQQKLLLKLAIEAENQAQTQQQKTMIENLCDFDTIMNVPLLQAHFFAKKEEYIQAVPQLLYSKNPLISKTVFKFLQQNLSKLSSSSNKKKYDDLNRTILDNLQTLIQMDIRKTRDLIFLYQKDNEQEVIGKLGNNKILQLEYIEQIITQDYQLDIKIDNEILKRHINLLCEFKPNRVLQQLKSMDYPLEEVLQVCQQHQHLEANAYILERMGQIVDAIDLQQRLLNDLIGLLIQKLKNFDCLTQIELQNLKDKMEEILNICIKNNKFDNSEDFWYLYLDNLLKQAEFANTDQTKELKDILIERVGQIFEEIAVHSSLELFAQNLSQKYSYLSIINYKTNFIKMLNTFYYQVNFIQNIKQLLHQCLFDEKRILMHRTTKGYFITCHCDVCGEKADSGIQFYCGHFLHLNCFKNESVCPKCLESESFYLEQIQQKQKLRMNKLTNIERQVQHQTNANKIQQYKQSLQNSQADLQKQEKFSREQHRACLRQFDLRREVSYAQIDALRKEILG